MSDNLDKLDFDISYDIIFGKEEVDLIDIYEPKVMTMEVDLPDDEFVTFSSDLIKCFRAKIKEGEHKVKVDTLIEVYRNAEASYDQSKNYSLSLWCMASVNAFLGIVEASNFDASPSAEQIENAEKDLGEFKLTLDFASIKNLYLETRREALAERSAKWVEI